MQPILHSGESSISARNYDLDLASYQTYISKHATHPGVLLAKGFWNTLW